jgi:hypothetical protein
MRTFLRIINFKPFNNTPQNMKTIITLAFLFINSFTYAQVSWQWAKNVYYIEDSRIKSDGENIYVYGSAGTSIVFSDWSDVNNMIEGKIPYNQGFLLKVNPEGRLQWGISVGGYGVDELYSIAIDKDENVYVTGYFMDSTTIGGKSFEGKGKTDIYLAKYDKAGKPIWTQTFGSYEAEEGIALAINSSNEVVLYGLIRDSLVLGNIKLKPSKVTFNRFIAVFDSEGTVKWAKLIEGHLYGGLNNLTIDQFDNIYLASSYYSELKYSGITIPYKDQADAFVTKLDKNGNLLWFNSIGSNGSEYIESLIVDDSLNVYIGGSFGQNCKFDTVLLNSVWGPNGFVAKLNSEGKFDWHQHYKTTRTNIQTNVSVHGITRTSDGIYATGDFEDIVKFGENTYTSPEARDIFITKTSFDGKLLWVKQFGNSRDDMGISLTTINDQAYLYGYYQDSLRLGNSGMYSQDFYSRFLASFDESVTSVPASKKNDGINFYPNPAKEELTVNFENIFTEPSVITISDMNGKEVYSGHASTNSHKILLHEFSPGIYFLHIDNSQLNVREKIVVR